MRTVNSIIHRGELFSFTLGMFTYAPPFSAFGCDFL